MSMTTAVVPPPSEADEILAIGVTGGPSEDTKVVNSEEVKDEDCKGAAEATVSTSGTNDMVDGRVKDVYDRFSAREKNKIVAIVSYSALLSRK